MRDAAATARGERQETIDEALSPRAQRTGTATRGPRTERDGVRGYRVECALDRMHRDHPREVTTAHVAAGNRFLRDYEVGVMGARLSSRQQERVSGGSAPDVPQSRLDAIRRYHDAVASMGRQASDVLDAVVIHGAAVATVARDLGTTPHRAMGRVVAALERLREHYDAAPRERGERE